MGTGCSELKKAAVKDMSTNNTESFGAAMAKRQFCQSQLFGKDVSKVFECKTCSARLVCDPCRLRCHKGHQINPQYILVQECCECRDCRHLNTTEARNRRLINAAKSKENSVLKSLIDKGADVNYVFDGTETALISAAACGHVEIVQTLLDAGATVNFTNKKGQSAVSTAVITASRFIDEIFDLLERRKLRTERASAVPYNYVEIVAMLEENEVDCTMDYEIPLCPKGHALEFVSSTPLDQRQSVSHEFASQCSNINSDPPCYNELSTGMYQCGCQSCIRVRLCENCGEKEAIEATIGEYALRCGLYRIALFISEGGDPYCTLDDIKRRQASDRRLLQTFHHKTHQKYEALKKFLLDEGIDPNFYDPKNFARTPLIVLATERNSTNDVDLLLQADAHCDVRDKREGRGGWTPLHYAVLQGRPDIVELLLAAGTSQDSKDTYHDYTPLDYAQELLDEKQFKFPWAVHNQFEIYPPYEVPKESRRDVVSVLLGGQVSIRKISIEASAGTLNLMFCLLNTRAGPWTRCLLYEETPIENIDEEQEDTAYVQLTLVTQIPVNLEEHKIDATWNSDCKVEDDESIVREVLVRVDGMVPGTEYTFRGCAEFGRKRRGPLSDPITLVYHPQKDGFPGDIRQLSEPELVPQPEESKLGGKSERQMDKAQERRRSIDLMNRRLSAPELVKLFEANDSIAHKDPTPPPRRNSRAKRVLPQTGRPRPPPPRRRSNFRSRSASENQIHDYSDVVETLLTEDVGRSSIENRSHIHAHRRASRKQNCAWCAPNSSCGEKKKQLLKNARDAKALRDLIIDLIAASPLDDGLIDCKDENGVTPLMYAAKYDDYELADGLLKRGVDFTMTDMKEDAVALQYAPIGSKTYDLLKMKFMYPQKTVFRASDIDVKEKFREGSNGVFLRCILRPLYLDVVVKVPKKSHSDWFELEVFENLPRHRNVLAMHGMCMAFRFEDFFGPALVIPWKQGGSLQDCIALRRGVPLPTWKLHTFALEMARGVSHLHDNNYYHGNIRLFSFMLEYEETFPDKKEQDWRQCVALSDFSLSRNVKRDMNQSKVSLDWRYCAPETLRNSFHKTFKTDIWAFGIALYGLLGFSNGPFALVSSASQFLNNLQKYRHAPLFEDTDTSIDCSHHFHNLILRCCSVDPFHRPVLKDVIHELQYPSLSHVDRIDSRVIEFSNDEIPDLEGPTPFHRFKVQSIPSNRSDVSLPPLEQVERVEQELDEPAERQRPSGHLPVRKSKNHLSRFARRVLSSSENEEQSSDSLPSLEGRNRYSPHSNSRPLNKY